MWEKGLRAASTPVGVLLMLAKGFDNDTARWINQNPIGSQGTANEWQVYRVRLTDPRMLVGNRFNGTPWNGNVAGLSVSLGTGPIGSTVQMDWIRLTAASTVTLAWQSLGQQRGDHGDRWHAGRAGVPGGSDAACEPPEPTCRNRLVPRQQQRDLGLWSSHAWHVDDHRRRVPAPAAPSRWWWTPRPSSPCSTRTSRVARTWRPRSSATAGTSPTARTCSATRRRRARCST